MLKTNSVANPKANQEANSVTSNPKTTQEIDTETKLKPITIKVTEDIYAIIKLLAVRENRKYPSNYIKNVVMEHIRKFNNSDLLKIKKRNKDDIQGATLDPDLW